MGGFSNRLQLRSICSNASAWGESISGLSQNKTKQRKKQKPRRNTPLSNCKRKRDCQSCSFCHLTSWRALNAWGCVEQRMGCSTKMFCQSLKIIYLPHRIKKKQTKNPSLSQAATVITSNYRYTCNTPYRAHRSVAWICEVLGEVS